MDYSDKIGLIAPCGMNCGICLAYLRDKNNCSGCRAINKGKPVTRVNCRIKNCSLLRDKTGYCFQCCSFPCDKLKHLDIRYRTKYNMSMIENLVYIENKGIEKFIKKEAKRWRCPECGGTICVHKGYCLNCSTERKSDNGTEK